MPSKKLYYIRKFLNKKGYHEGAFILAEIVRSVVYGRKDKKTGKRKKFTDHYCTLNIADYSSIISLDFSLSGKGNRKNSLYKLNVLIDTLIEFRNEFMKEEKIIEKQWKKSKRKVSHIGIPVSDIFDKLRSHKMQTECED